MPLTHYYAGPATIKVATRSPGSDSLSAYSELGINREAIPVVVQPRFLDVPSDDWAGTDGAPADAQYMGAIATIQLSLTKFDKAICDRLVDGYLYTGSVAGTMLQFGSFMRQGGHMFALQLDSQLTAGKTDEKLVTYTYCFVRNGGAVGHGTRYSSYDLIIEAWLDATTTRKLYEIDYTG